MSTQVFTFENLPLKDLGGWINEKESELIEFDKSVKGDWNDDRLDVLKARHAEIEAAKGRFTRLSEAEAIITSAKAHREAMKEPVRSIPFQGNGKEQDAEKSIKSLGEMFTDSHAYKSIGSHGSGIANPYAVEMRDVEMRDAVKTLMTTAAGWAPSSPRGPVVVPYGQREPRLGDIIPSDSTTQPQVKYMEETTPLAGTNAQVAIAEGAAKFENTLALTERTVQVEKVGTFLHVTTEQLDDVPGIQSFIDNRLMTFLLLKEEDLLLNGSGVTPQIEGFLTKSIGSQARGTDSNIAAVFKAIQKNRTAGFAEPDAIVMHPDNFTPIALYQNTGGDFTFNPLTDNGGVVRLWGKTLILTPAITANTALVGAFRLFSHISRRMGMTIQVGMNGDDFKENKRTILAEFRESLEVYRLLAFTKVTSLQ